MKLRNNCPLLVSILSTDLLKRSFAVMYCLSIMVVKRIVLFALSRSLWQTEMWRNCVKNNNMMSNALFEAVSLEI